MPLQSSPGYFAAFFLADCLEARIMPLCRQVCPIGTYAAVSSKADVDLCFIGNIAASEVKLLVVGKTSPVYET